MIRVIPKSIRFPAKNWAASKYESRGHQSLLVRRGSKSTKVFTKDLFPVFQFNNEFHKMCSKWIFTLKVHLIFSSKPKGRSVGKVWGCVTKIPAGIGMFPLLIFSFAFYVVAKVLRIFFSIPSFAHSVVAQYFYSTFLTPPPLSFLVVIHFFLRRREGGAKYISQLPD